MEELLFKEIVRNTYLLSLIATGIFVLLSVLFIVGLSIRDTLKDKDVGENATREAMKDPEKATGQGECHE